MIKVYFIKQQNQLFLQLANLLQQQLAEVQFTVLGLGKSCSFPTAFTDLRVLPRQMNEETERNWYQAYASSHVVVGVHGSNMLIPSLLAASFISLVPPYKILSQGEDLI